MMGKCGEHDNQLEGLMAHRSKATQLYQSYIQHPSNTEQSSSVARGRSTMYLLHQACRTQSVLESLATTVENK